MLEYQRTAMALGDERILRAGPWLWLRALAWMIFSVFAVALAFGLYSDAIPKHLSGTSEAAAFAARCTGPLVVLLIYALLVRLGENRRPTEVAPRVALPHLAAGLALGTAMFGLVMLLLIGSGLYQFHWIGLSPAWHDAGAAIEAGVVEEVLIRGLVLRVMWRAFGPIAAFLISAAAFGVGHLGNDNVTIFAVFCIALEAGVMLGAFYALTGHLWVSIGVHVSWNFSQGYLFGAMVSGESLGPALAVSSPRNGFPDWLTGGPFGPEASLPALLVCSAVGGVTLWLAWRAGQFRTIASNAVRSSIDVK